VLDHLERHPDEHDLFFFGSSRTKRGLVPEVFDREMERLGYSFCSFNFGVGGMGTHESNAFLRHVLSRRPALPRWVVFELDAWYPDLDPRNRFKRRTVSWHDLPETLSVCRSSLRLEAPLVERLELLTTHLLHMAARYANVGTGPAVIRDLREGPRPVHPAVAADRGYVAEAAPPQRREVRRRFLENLDADDAWVEESSRGEAPDGRPAAYHGEAVLDQVEWLRARGIRVVYFLPPDPLPIPELVRMEQEGLLRGLIRFNDPRAFPDLFRHDRRYDRRHLNRRGAEELTRAFARRFAAHLREIGAE